MTYRSVPVGSVLLLVLGCSRPDLAEAPVEVSPVTSASPDFVEIEVIGKPEGIDRKLGSIRYFDVNGKSQIVGSISWPNEIKRAVTSGLDVEVDAYLKVRESQNLGRYASDHKIRRYRTRTSANANFGAWQNVQSRSSKNHDLPPS